MFRFLFDPAFAAFLGLVGFQLIPIGRAIHRRRVNFLAVAMAGSFVVFSANRCQSLFSGVAPEVWPRDVRVEIYALLVAHILIQATYLLVSRKLAPTLHRPSLRPSEMKGWQALMASMLVCLIALMTLPSGLQQVAFATQTALLVFLMFSEVVDHTMIAVIARLLLSFTFIAVFVQNGTLSFAVSLAILGAIRCLMWQRPRHAISLCALVLTMGFLQPIKANHRNFLMAYPISSFAARLSNTTDLLSARWAGSETSALQNAKTRKGEYVSGFRRVGDDSLGRVLTLTPTQVPYWHGTSYQPLLWMLVPRAVWPNKPGVTTWHTFGQRYGYLRQDDPATSITFNFLAEAFMNFGISAFVLAAIGYGLILGLSENWLVRLMPGQTAVPFTLFVLPFAVPNDTTSVISSTAFFILLLSSARLLPHLIIRARKLLRPKPLRSLLNGTRPGLE